MALSLWLSGFNSFSGKLFLFHQDLFYPDPSFNSHLSEECLFVSVTAWLWFFCLLISTMPVPYFCNQAIPEENHIHALYLRVICTETLKKFFFKKNKFNQRSEKMQKENSQVRQNDTSAFKQSQGPLALPQGLQITFWAMSFDLFGRCWNPHQMEEVKYMLPTSTQTPDQLEPEGWWCWLSMTSPPTNQKNVHELVALLFEHYDSSLPAPGWLPLACKAVKAALSHFTQNGGQVSIWQWWPGARFRPHSECWAQGAWNPV